MKYVEPAQNIFFPKIFWLIFRLIWKNYIQNWDFDMKSWIEDFFTHFCRVFIFFKEIVISVDEKGLFSKKYRVNNQTERWI